jgi:cytochrome c oxidase subunit II|tara:strand:- start:2296 stop:3435 length:1140 start_codon:yes stop_codon:yes gene_type:complete
LKSIYQKFLALILFTPLTALADWGLNMTQGVTPISKEIYDMHMLTLWVVTVIGILVFGVMFWSIFHHRKSKGAKASKFSHSTTVEIIWTIVPTAIIIALAIPATKLLIKMDDTSEAKITIKATGIQWKWKYDYLDEDITLYSSLDAKSQEVAQRDSGQNPMEYENYLLDVDEPLVVPVNTKLRILTTAEDVIHAWWVPELGWKRDAIPGFINDNWAIIEEPGTYRGNCTEICGKGHGYMPIVVKAVSMEDYEAWIEDRKALKLAALESQNKTLTMDESMAEGEKVYKKQCLMCHQANGQGVPGAFPALAGSEIALKKENTLEHLYRIIYGKNLMPKFGDQLSDVEIATVTTYERNAWGNNTGDLIQPKEVAEARKNQTK